MAGGQVGVRDRAGEHDVFVQAGGRDSPPQLTLVGAAAHQQQRRVGDVAVDQRQCVDEPVLALARHQPGDASDDGAFAEAVAVADGGAVGLG